MRSELQDYEDFLLMLPYLKRALRAAGYGVCAWLLLMANTYPIEGSLSIVLAVTILGAASASARLGQIAIVALLAMALVPFPLIAAFFP